ncbi:MAG TPA: Gfo/Idh/MocA family oxidoreductase [Thermoleophilaceae bacterium]|nr:Gfo/Idh/MocA family oxidoreductase [Thermoleophilaceae bacterium]
MSGVRARADRPVNLAVVGLGYWGPNLVRNLVELPTAEVCCACDPRSEALTAIARRYPGVRTEEDFSGVLEDPAIEAVVLATPVSTHYQLAVAALDAGKHVFVEKPLAESSTHAADLISRADGSGLVLMPGHTFLYSPPVNLARDLIGRGELGEIYFISTSRVNLGLHQRDVSVVWDLAPHDFSILRYWLDEAPVRVSAISRGCVDPNTADVAFIDLEFRSGAIAHVEIAWLAPSKLRRTAVIGSEKMLVYDDTSNEQIRIFDSGAALPDPESFGEYQLSYRTGDIVSPHLESHEPLSLELADFCEAVRTGSEPRSSSALGLDVVAMTEAVDRSLDAGGLPVPVEPAVAQATG